MLSTPTEERLEIRIEQQAKKIVELEGILQQGQSNSELSRRLLEAKTWEEIESEVGRDRAVLLKALKSYSTSQRQRLSTLLSQHLDANPEALEQVLIWAPEKLVIAALKYGLQQFHPLQSQERFRADRR